MAPTEVRSRPPFADAWLRPGRRSVVLAWAAALALAAMAWFAGGLDRVQTAWHDRQAQLFAPQGPIDGVLLVDIDEPSVHALRPQFGGWPPSRELMAQVTGYLLDAGARAVVIDLVLADPRDGDAALFSVMAAHPGRVVLAASVLPAQADAAAGRPSLPGPGGCAVQPWAGLLLPAPALLASPSRLGMVSMPTDADGQLRQLPLWHADDDRVLPALPLAAWLAVSGSGVGSLRCTSDGWLLFDGLRLPIDAQGQVRPAWRRSGAVVPLRSYASVASAALGTARDALPDAELRGRVVFIGASAVLGDRVQTPLGPRWGPSLLAETFAALESGALITPPRLALDLLWLWLACVPALLAWRYGALRPRADLLAAVATLVLLLGLDAAVYAAAAQQSRVAWSVLALPLFALLSLLQWRRTMLRTQRQLERERSDADTASRVKSEFLAHMSHEIRTPMNALLGSAELLAKTPLDARQSRHVALFQSAGASLLEILNDLLDLSKIEAGLLGLDRQPFSLVDLVASQTVLFEARASQKGLRLETEFDPDLPPVVVGDGARLAQVLRNLLGNAVKFTHQGHVTLAVRRVAGAPDRLRFEVRDTGIGIPAGKQQEIFQAFTQADSGVARAYGGTGLGLTISLRLAALMGGDIGVESREGEGSVFHLEIDLPASFDAPMALWAPSAPEPSSDFTLGLRVLLADDNPQNVQLVLAYLENDGHAIDVVHDGDAAIRRFREGRYDVVLMDVQMPGMDGYRATAALRAIERERGDGPVPVIALTANAMPDDERRSLQAGCSAHLTKPFSRGQLRRVLAEWSQGEPPPAPPEEVAPFADGPWPLPALAMLDGFDIAPALARMEGDVKLYLRVLQAAGPVLRDWDQRFSRALGEADLPQALRLAHDLKSSAATLGADALSAAARRLESALREGDAQAAELAPAHRAVQALLPVLLAVLERPSP